MAQVMKCLSVCKPPSCSKQLTIFASFSRTHRSNFHSRLRTKSREITERKKNKGPQEVTIKLSEADKSKDYIGPADPVSNIRQISFRTENQSKLEKDYHRQCEEVTRFNQEFWTKHNTNFGKEKDAFVAERLRKKKSEENTLSAEEMSEFYREFLNKNYKSHVQYNIDWYKKNISLLLPAFKVATYRLLKRLGVR